MAKLSCEMSQVRAPTYPLLFISIVYLRGFLQPTILIPEEQLCLGLNRGGSGFRHAKKLETEMIVNSTQKRTSNQILTIQKVIEIQTE